MISLLIKNILLDNMVRCYFCEAGIDGFLFCVFCVFCFVLYVQVILNLLLGEMQ